MSGVAGCGNCHHGSRIGDTMCSGEYGGTAETVTNQYGGCAAGLPQIIGGGDKVMLDDLFLPQKPADKYFRAADQRGGAYSILTGIAANHSIRNGKTVEIAELVREPRPKRRGQVSLLDRRGGAGDPPQPPRDQRSDEESDRAVQEDGPQCGHDDLAAEISPGGRLDQLLTLGKTLDVTWVIDPDLLASVDAMTGSYPVSDKLSWDLFLGVAPDVEYHPLYHPFNWRGWVDWGQGALGDMGAHLIDHPVWGLKLGLPTVIETTSTPFNKVSYPNATTTYYEFPARKGMPAVKMVWYDGGLMPPKPEELGEESLVAGGGIMYVGSKGKMLQETYGERPRLLPADRHNSYGAPKEKLARVPHEAHEMNWVNAIRGRDEISSPFSYAAHLTEIMLLGVVSLRAKSKLHYDGATMKVTNNDAANEFLTRVYREGYSL